MIKILQYTLNYNNFFFKFCQYTTQKEHYKFQADTNRLLEIFKQNVYTDKDIFIKELLQNATEAIEKYTKYYPECKIEEQKINISINPSSKQIIIQDTGIGFTRNQLQNFLGYICKMDEKQENSKKSTGLGFFSSFVAAYRVEVISKKDGEEFSHGWKSNGEGEFELYTIKDIRQKRGTKIILNIKNEFQEYLKSEYLQNVVIKYSNLLNYPIFINGNSLELQNNIFMKDFKEINDFQYLKTFQYLTGLKLSYQHKILYENKQLKFAFFIPSTHSEFQEFYKEQAKVILYNNRALITENMIDFLPNYMRFIKGLVDIYPVEVNVSRNNFLSHTQKYVQEAQQIVKEKIIQGLLEYSEKESDKYLTWYKQFQHFLKEGILIYQFIFIKIKKGLIYDQQNQEKIADLLRFDVNYKEKMISIKNYLEKSQKNLIYYGIFQDYNDAIQSIFVQELEEKGIPIIFLYDNQEQSILQQLSLIKKLNAVNIITEFDKVLILESFDDINSLQNLIPQGDVDKFLKWIKIQLQPTIRKVEEYTLFEDQPAIMIKKKVNNLYDIIFIFFNYFSKYVLQELI
ncbi:TNF receptor-associated protein 1, putative [Ichthyophthirius multifiliis]|uniref:TNF receptor-associated protein 1, putative n=1 Tax=Ichthyophthirius multifiliis TaxID=5932 RepID=G0R5I6_ICHMU|nr:TNF receptor-associated protein 1, putative [Ichthyophthirius multifiliis]EGR27246.1 TNF receptor-associated protein 1, putative [Ichthyophthirius multifiliis]|eukprot:XP_004024130.1 TNF receptor-associated protein 1, putative [Ichthyophthirius multifiliis]